MTVSLFWEKHYSKTMESWENLLPLWREYILRLKACKEGILIFIFIFRNNYLFLSWIYTHREMCLMKKWPFFSRVISIFVPQSFYSSHSSYENRINWKFSKSKGILSINFVMLFFNYLCLHFKLDTPMFTS